MEDITGITMEVDPWDGPERALVACERARKREILSLFYYTDREIDISINRKVCRLINGRD